MKKAFIFVLTVVSVCVTVMIASCNNPSPFDDEDEGDGNGNGIVDQPELVEFDIFNELYYTGMIPVKGGTFTMGATQEQGSDYYDKELPTHEVTLSDYYIGKYEVTQQLWEYVINYSGTCANGSTISAYTSEAWHSYLYDDEKGDYYPMYNITYNDIVEVFLPRLRRITGKEYRLPTEAEWEFAARGGNMSQGYKYSGSNNIDAVAWYSSNSSPYNNGYFCKTQKVGTKQVNELGLYDMSGNVGEVCSDWYGSYSSSAQKNPAGPVSGTHLVLRGGSCSDDARDCRVSSRGFTSTSNRYHNVGFRLACGAGQ